MANRFATIPYQSDVAIRFLCAGVTAGTGITSTFPTSLKMFARTLIHTEIEGP
jgi:hypothetical protein